MSWYNRALSEGEIAALYNAGAAGKCLSPPYITGFTRSANTFTLTWTARRGLRYRVQYKENSGDPAWIEVNGDVIATGSTASKTDVLPGAVSRRLYRVVMFR